MATKSTAKAPAAAAAAGAAPAAAAPAAAPAKPKTVDTFTFIKNVPEGGKLAPQARVIVNVLQEKTSLTRDALNVALEGKLQTRQPIGRIVTYYQKTLVEAGYISITEAPAVA